MHDIKPQQSIAQRIIISATVCYAVLLIYGTLFPLSGWQYVSVASGINEILSWPSATSYSDFIVNLIVYIPLGILFSFLLRFTFNPRFCIVLTVVFGFSLSFSLEFIQAFLPDRVTSFIDIVLNTAGSLAGSVVAFYILPLVNLFFKKDFVFGLSIKHDIVAELGIVVFAMWIAAELSPLVPSLDVGNIKDGIKPLWYWVNHPTEIDIIKLVDHYLLLFSLAVVGATTLKNEYNYTRFITIAIASTLFLKIIFIYQQLNIEWVVSMIAIIVTLAATDKMGNKSKITAGFLFVIILIEGLWGTYDFGAIDNPINWIPFYGHMTNLLGIIDIIEGIWPAAALGYLTILSIGQKKSGLLLGAVIILMLYFTIELLQQFIPGRYPDMTDVAIALIGWFFPWLYIAARLDRKKTILDNDSQQVVSGK